MGLPANTWSYTFVCYFTTYYRWRNWSACDIGMQQKSVGHKMNWCKVVGQWFGSGGGIVYPLLTENHAGIADIKVVLSLLKEKKTQPCDSPLKVLVNHQPGRHSTSPLVSGTREGGEGGDLCCQSLSSALTLMGPHHTGLRSCPVTGRS